MTRTSPSLHKLRVINVTLLGVIFMLLVGYAYLLNRTIVEAVVIQDSREALAAVNVRVGALEGQYFEAKKGITQARARELGFEEVTSLTYLSRGGEKRTLSLNNEN